MGAYYGKITGNVESDSDSRDDSVADDDNSLGKETTGRTTAVSQSFSEKLKDWRSVSYVVVGGSRGRGMWSCPTHP